MFVGFFFLVCQCENVLFVFLQMNHCNICKLFCSFSYWYQSVCLFLI